MAVYPFLQTSFVDKKSLTQRQQVLETIAKLVRGESFQAYKEKFIMEKNMTLEDEELIKLFVSYNFLSTVIDKIVALCPDLDKVTTRNNKKRKLIVESLNDIDWKAIEYENYKNLESCGDTFLEIYFDNQHDKVPKLRVLNSANMQRCLMDDYNRYHSYIYKEQVEDLVPNYTDSGVTINSSRERVIVFQKGRKVIYDPKTNIEGKIELDKDNNVVYTKEVILNRESYISDFPLIHIKGNKKQAEEFSFIPAEKYIDPSLVLDQITSDIRQINRMLGYPLIMIIDGKLVMGAKRSPAAVMGVESTNKDGTQATVKDIQISNKLDSVFNEFHIARDDLFDKAGLMNPTLQNKMNGDSSRVYYQNNIASENKIELYIDNIIKSMQLWFKILLKENGVYNEKTDKNLSFDKPKFILKTSPFDKLLFEQSEIKSLKKSVKEVAVENMDTDEEIALREKEINETLGDDNKDRSFVGEGNMNNQVSNGQGIDNNMINNI